MEKKESRPSLVDAGKLLAIIIVIMIHTDACGDYDWSARVFNQYVKIYAVPFFFVCSGFFLGCKIRQCITKDDYRNVILRYFRRLLIPYLVWGSINFCIEIFVNMSKRMSFLKALTLQLHTLLVSAPGRALWYVQAILFILLILFLLTKQSQRIGLLGLLLCSTMIIPCATTVSLFGDANAGHFLEKYFIYFLTEHNFLFYGAFFVIGSIAAEKEWFSKVNIKTCIALVGLAILINVVGHRSEHLYPVSQRISELIFALFCFGLLYLSKAKFSWNCSITLRKMSTVFYFTHIAVKYAIQFVFQQINISSGILVFLMTMLVLTLYFQLYKRVIDQSKPDWIYRIFTTIY